MLEQPFESWAIVELFGRQVIAGKVSDAIIGGQSFVRVDVPQSNGIDPYTKFYGGGAVYCITPTDEATARAAATGLKAKPVDVWKLNLPKLEAPIHPFQHEEDEDHDLTEDDSDVETYLETA